MLGLLGLVTTVRTSWICKTTNAKHNYETRIAKRQLQNDKCKTSIAKAQLQNNNCITTIAKQQVLKQIFETLRGTPPGKRKIEHSKTVRKCKKREVGGTPPGCTTVLLQKPLRTPIGSASYTYHWGIIRNSSISSPYIFSYYRVGGCTPPHGSKNFLAFRKKIFFFKNLKKNFFRQKS